MSNVFLEVFPCYRFYSFYIFLFCINFHIYPYPFSDMLRLNPDILFEIGKKIVENGIQEDVYKFALSGKESFRAMKNVLASVKILKLYRDRYVIGWDDLCCTFIFKSDKLHMNLLMYCIGNSVTDLRICYYFSKFNRAIYQPILDKIVARKRLVKFSLSSNGYCDIPFLNEFLPQLSSSLKKVSIQSKYLTPTFLDSLNLESLTVLDNFDNRVLFFCCKTTSLTLAFKNRTHRFDNSVKQCRQLSPSLSSVKQLMFEYNIYPFQLNHGRFEELMKYFPSLELVKFDVSYFSISETSNVIDSCSQLINAVAKVPSKVVLEFFNLDKSFDVLSSTVCADFELDESVPDFYVFRKIVLSAVGGTTVLEVKFRK